MRLLIRGVAETPLVLRRNVSHFFAHSFIKARASDQYIVSYPRSGSTWLRTILATILCPENGFQVQTFDRLIPGVSGRRLPRIWSLGDPRIIHSHSPYRKCFPRVVYLVRDGRDALISYYHYTTTRVGKNVPFSKWFDLYCRHWYGPRWEENVDSWLERGRRRLGENFYLVKFEEMKIHPTLHAEKIADFLNIPTTPEAISHAVRMASLEKARQREIQDLGVLGNEDAGFYRGGRTGQWQAYLNEELYRKFINLSKTAMSLAGYDW